jgi:hypothetical protein
VATPVNLFQAPGKYKFELDKEGLIPGVYYYKMEAGTFLQTKKLILIK